MYNCGVHDLLLLCTAAADPNAVCGCLQGGDLLDWTNRDGGIQEESFIQRIEALSTMGYSVLLSNYRRYFSLASYLSTFSKESIVISMGIPSVRVRRVLTNDVGLSYTIMYVLTDDIASSYTTMLA